MCTAAEYSTKHHYFGRNLDLEYSYHEEVTITPRHFPFQYRRMAAQKTHYAIIGMAFIAGGYPLYYDAANEIRDQFRVIAPSRFGYPGSDLPEEASIEMQVQAFVELLDFLNIENTYLLATSAGSTVAIKFALMHPERTKGLILYCSGFPALEARR